MLALALFVPAAARGDSGGDIVRPLDLTDAPRVTIVMVPNGTDVEQISEAAPGISPGLLGGGLGEVPSAQTYLDITQGGRLAQSLYPSNLRPVYVVGDRVPERVWRRVRSRAANAPAEIDPGMMAARLEDRGVPVAAADGSGSAAIIAIDRAGRIARTRGCEPPACPGLSVVTASVDGLAEIASRFDRDSDDLLIAIERPPTDRELLSVGILGKGFENGDLISPTTRMRGYVLTTDMLPTILARYGIDSPKRITGREIETSGDQADPAGVIARGDRLGVVRERRGATLGFNLLVWIVLVGLAAAVGRSRAGAVGLSVLAVTMALVPALLLVTAALAPSALGERLFIGIATPLLAAALLLVCRRFFGGRAAYAAFALAAALSIGAEAVDIVLGSPLTALSLLGSNPEQGVRFFGIGNELEATIGVLLMLGAGAAASVADLAPRRIAALVVGVTVAAVLVFAPGRLGADVGAAITFPAGAAVAVIFVLHLGWRRAALVIAAPILAVVLLLGIDLVTGGDAHLSRSVLGAGGIQDLEDVLQRRVEASLRSFPNYLESAFFKAALVAIAGGLVFRRRIAGWLQGDLAAQTGVVGAIAATIVGTLANDSAALLLMVGTGFITAFCGLAWASSQATGSREPRYPEHR